MNGSKTIKRNLIGSVPNRVINKKASILNDLIHCFLLVCFLKILCCKTFFNANQIISLLLLAVLTVIILFAVVYIFDKLSVSISVGWLLLLVFLLISFCKNKSGLEYICNTIIFLGLLTVLPYTHIKFSTAKICFILYAVYCLLVILFAPKFDMNDTEAIVNDGALFNLNTNTSSIVLILFEFAACSFASATKDYKKILFYILAVIAFLFQLSFAGRSSLIGTGLLVVYLVFKKFFNTRNINTVRILVMILCAFSIIFTYLYAVVLFNLIGHGKVYILGKDLFTGRQLIWNDAFNQINGHWLLGIGNRLAATSIGDDTLGSTSLHNQMLGYLTCFGLFVVVSYIFLLGNLVARIFKDTKRKYSVAFVISLTVMSYFETIIYSSQCMIYVSVILVMLFVFDTNRCKHKKVRRHKTKK
jgi:O-antigen ligase